MNVKIDIDMTPEELRRLVGLPDVQEFNQKIVEQMLQKMQENAFDPAAVFKAGIAGPELFRQWFEAFSQFGDGGKSKSGKS